MTLDLGLGRFLVQQEFNEKLAGVWRWGVLRNCAWGNHEQGAVRRIDDTQRISFVTAQQGRRLGAGGHPALLGIQHGHCIVDRAADLRLILFQLLKVIPAVELTHLHHPGSDIAAERRMPDGHLSLPFGVKQVRPVLRRVFLGHQAVVVGDQHQGCCSDGVVIFRIVVLLERIHHLGKIIGPVLQQQSLFLKVRIVAHIGAAEDRCHRDVGLQVLLEPL